MNHIPVLLNEVLKALDPKPGEFFIDGTVGGGGHAASILEKMGGRGKFLGIDLDEKSLKIVRDKIEAKSEIPRPRRSEAEGGRNSKFEIFWEHDSYAEIPEILKRKKLPKADMLLLDLGFSSTQIDDPKRGFSFKHDGPLDMRYRINNDHDNDYDNDGAITAAEVLDTFSEDALAEIFKNYGEERYARFVAKKIVERRKRARIITTLQLSQLVEEVYRNHCHGHRHGRRGIHPATRVFQALRIFVNSELENLEKILKEIQGLMAPGGRVAIISFHSLEDKLVKHCFREIVKSGRGELIFKKPVKPTREEIAKNPRSRSAKLRAIRM